MDNLRGQIKYYYQDSRWSQSAIKHAFAYISAITGIRFVEEKSSAEIWKSDREDAPQTVKLVLGNLDGKTPGAFIKTGNGWERIGDTDSISEVITKISAFFFLGPFSEGTSKPASDGESTLSGLIDGLFKTLIRVGLAGDFGRAIDLWPSQAKFALALSHDTDIARRSIPGSLKLLFHKWPKGGLKGLSDSALAAVGMQRNPYDAIEQWIDYEKRIGIKSTFFIFAGDRKHPNDPKYSLDELNRAFESIRQNGYELALHSGIENWSGESVENEKAKLEQYTGLELTGIRPHFLSCRFPDYWQAAQRNGISYSSSLGSDKAIGFLNGIDLPYIPFNPETNEYIPIVELPISIMDCGLIGDGPAASPRIFEHGETLLEKASRTGGLIVLDWHQRTFYNPDYPGWAGLCFRLIKRARELGAHITTLGETAAELKKRFKGIA